MKNLRIISTDDLEEIKKAQFLILKKIDAISSKVPDDELVTVKQAHEITKISEQMIRDMIKKGKLKTNDKYGNAKRIYRNSL